MAGADEVQAVIDRMGALLAPLQAGHDPRRHFLATYRRTTIAVHDAMQGDTFLDAAWVARWDVAFARLYLDALEAWDGGRPVSGPWQVAFSAAGDPSVVPLRHVLLGMNAHINGDLPLALLATIDDGEFADAHLVARRREDHTRIDAILSSRVDAEDRELQAVEGPGQRTWVDRALRPFNQAASRRFMAEARRKVWANTLLLQAARLQGEEVLAERRRALEVVAEARVADLRKPGQVLLRLAVRGFGVTLPA